MWNNHEVIDRLFAEVARRVRSLVCQSAESIVQLSHQRLRGNPIDVDALHVLAAFKLRSCDPQRSLAILGRNPTSLANNATGHRIAAYAHLAQNQAEAARRHFAQSVWLDPRQADCWRMLARLHEDSGQHDSAIRCYQRAILFDDARHESTLALSRLQVKHNNIKEAIHTLRVSLLRDQRSARLNLALARLLRRRAAVFGWRRNLPARRRFLEEACRCYETANASAPTSASCIAEGLVQRALERFEEATRAFQRAVAVDPACPVAATHLGNAYLESGNIEQALQLFQTAIARDPQRANAHFRFTRAKRFRPDPASEAYLQQLSELVADPSRSRPDRVHLHFALAKVLDDTGHYRQAWQHYDAANRLKPGHSAQRRRHSTSPNPGTLPVPLQHVVEQAVGVFTQDFFAARASLGHPSDTPVFIVGMPRSGTTLTEQILSSHPSVAGGGELKTIEQLRQRLVGPVERLRGGHHSAYPEILARVDGFQIHELAESYLAELNRHCKGQLRVTDKMPTNFMHLGLIALLFPRATVIHCRRNPMDVLVSCYCQNLNAPFCDLDQLVDYHRNYRRLMAHWQHVLPLQIHTVDYESLVTDPALHSQRLVECCGLPWDARCLLFHQNERAVHTPSKWQVRQPMYASSIGAWRRFEPQLREIADRIQRDDEDDSLSAMG